MTYEISSSILSNTSTNAIANDAIAIRFVTDRAEWDHLVAAAPHPHLPQSFAYGKGKAATNWTPLRAVFSAGGRPVAFATILQPRRFGIRLLSRINRGPVFLEAEPSDERIVAVYAAIRRRWGQLWRGPLLIAPALPANDHSHALLRRAGYRLRAAHGWRSALIDLTQSEDEIWASFSSPFRNRVRQAEKAGATLRIASDDETFDWMLARHAENMVEKGFSAVGPALLYAMRDTAPENITIFQLLNEDAPVAGMSIARFGAFAEYHIGWFGPEGRRLNAGNFLMWKVMREMKRRGVKYFDVGGMRSGDGYTRFKQTMNPVEYDLAGEWMSF